MKTKTILVCTILLLLSFFSNSNAERRYDIKTVTIDISGNMICHVSVGIIEKKLKRAKGIESFEIDRTEKKITVRYDDTKTNLEKIEKVLTKAGFKANDKDADMMGYDSLPDCCKIK